MKVKLSRFVIDSHERRGVDWRAYDVDRRALGAVAAIDWNVEEHVSLLVKRLYFYDNSYRGESSNGSYFGSSSSSGVIFSSPSIPSSSSTGTASLSST